MTPEPPKEPPPPACAECITTMQSAVPGALPKQSPSRMLRATDGKMRVDFGNTSLINDPSAKKSILLDHLKKEAMTIPHPPEPQLTPPTLPSGQILPAAVPPQVVELGKALIEGHEVEGKQFTFPPVPKPALPKIPSPPQFPKLPDAPAAPEAPPIPTVAEVWTSTQTKLPVLTKVTGPLGQQICHCRVAPTAEPAAAAFEIPADYKQLKVPTSPEPPKLQPPQIHRPSLPRLG